MGDKVSLAYLCALSVRRNQKNGSELRNPVQTRNARGLPHIVFQNQTYPKSGQPPIVPVDKRGRPPKDGRETWRMRCPFCGNIDTQVKDSRPAEDHVAIRRRRFCPACGGRFTTYERVQLRDLVVIKSNGKREDFDRDKLERSIRIALQKRPVEPERMDQMISGIVRRLESMGETDIPSTTIGEIVMESLARIDTVAYVRFASVYKNFQAADDFDKFVSELRPPNKDE